jgi:hypothetical protein
MEHPPIACRSSVWASLVTGRTPVSPRATSERKKRSQKVPFSLGPMSTPSTSRASLAATPTATTTAWETTRPSCRALMIVASSHT